MEKIELEVPPTNKRITQKQEPFEGMEKDPTDRSFGFRRGKSTIQAVDEVVNIARSCANNEWAVLIILDVRNAANTASWDIMLLSLKTSGIQDYLLEIIDN
ncbi:hypothetical protein JTB14_009896 [Gonioctena quinquepunctata]|nr:hypothetical protein JTB14_009896 [Gonioctena quinquepunctata]